MIYQFEIIAEIELKNKDAPKRIIRQILADKTEHDLRRRVVNSYLQMGWWICHLHLTLLKEIEK